MPHRTIEQDVCRKHGHILTCYVNGKKRFRALAVVRPPAFRIADSSRRSIDGSSDRVSAVGL
jgi:hypothetical protein